MIENDFDLPISMDDLLGNTPEAYVALRNGRMVKVFYDNEPALPDNWRGRLTVANAGQVAHKIEQLLTGERFSILLGSSDSSSDTYRLSQIGDHNTRAVQVILDDELGAGLLVHVQSNERKTTLTCTGGYGNESEPESFNPHITLERNGVTFSQMTQNRQVCSWRIKIL